MKAKITNKEHENFGQTFPVVEIIKNRIVCLSIYGRKVDFGMSEIRLLADASLGAEAIWSHATPNDNVMRDSGIRTVSKRAAKAWGIKISDVEGAIHNYVWA